MRAKGILPLSIAFLAAPAVAGAADEPPRRKPGLWEVHSELNGKPSPVGAIQTCIDAKTDNLLKEGVSDAQSRCRQMTWAKEGDSYIIKSVCNIGKSVATTQGRFTGSFDSNYRGEMHMSYDPPLHGMSKSDMTLTATWLGPCKQGQKPGDIVMPNMPSIPGMPKTINMEDIMKMRDQLKRMQSR
ncbi:MAG: DUF3617 domain-containing protein [Methylocystis sp.]